MSKRRSDTAFLVLYQSSLRFVWYVKSLLQNIWWFPSIFYLCLVAMRFLTKILKLLRGLGPGSTKLAGLLAWVATIFFYACSACHSLRQCVHSLIWRTWKTIAQEGLNLTSLTITVGSISVACILLRCLGDWDVHSATRGTAWEDGTCFLTFDLSGMSLIPDHCQSMKMCAI